MKTIGLLGGMSWESTARYYALINQGIKARLGGLHSAKLCMVSVDFAEIETLQSAGEWTRAGERLVQHAKQVERGGADGLLICTNTMHKVADMISAEITIPLIHIADATGAALRAKAMKRVGLLGTRFTMEQPFYRERIRDNFGIEVLVPDEDGRNEVHRVIYEELCQGKIDAASRERYLAIIADLHAQGAEGVILGCTEIALLVEAQHTPVPLFDTAALHAEAAVEWALSPS